MTSTNDIRRSFLDYFEKNEHARVQSAPLVPHNDPTLMFVNAGMVPFKNVFTGLETRPYSTAVSSQKCVRAGGKHNDLDNVGYTARHLTFFEMLGPCSEIFYDHGADVPGGPPGSPGQDGDRFVEIWNLVFMQFEQENNEIVRDLPRPSIDTGMGLERIAAVLQGVHDNYDTDTFKALIAASSELTRTTAEGERQASHRVIADHLRASGFLISDGVLPANEGRGYVLRRIMRRAMRHAHILGAAEPLMHRLVPSLVAEMGAAYPELVRAQALIEETLKLEETRFRQTLVNGLKLLDEATAAMKPGEILPGG